MTATFSQGPDSSASVTEIVSGIVGDVQDLGKQHLTLFRNEMKEDFRKATDAAISLAIGLAVTQVGGLLMSLMFVYLIAHLAPGLSLWICYSIVGSVILALGALALWYGAQKLQRLETLSNQTAQAMKEDAQWLATPK